MTKFIRIAVAPLALVALIAACGKSDEAAADSRQVELAPAAAGQPQLGDTAQAAEAPAAKVATAPKPAPAKAAPAPAKSVAPAPAKAPTTGTIAAGTLMNASSSTRVCTNIANVGDRVNATLAQAGAQAGARKGGARAGQDGRAGASPGSGTSADHRHHCRGHGDECVE